MATADAVTQTAITDLEARLQDALMTTDLGWFKTNWAGDAVYVHLSGGVDDKQEFIERLRSKATIYNGRTYGDLQIRQYGDAVVSTGESSVDILVSGEQKLLDTRFTRVYVKDGGRRLMATSQSGANRNPKNKG